MANEIKFEIIEHIGVLSTNERTGWTTELNVVSVNDGEAKYDIRDWPPNKEKMGKGFRLSSEQFLSLKELLGGGHE